MAAEDSEFEREVGETPLASLSVLYPSANLARRWAATHFGGNQLFPGLLRSFAPTPRSGERTARQHPCGPPPGFRPASPCPGVDRPASGLTAVTPRPIRTPCLPPQGGAHLSVSLRLRWYDHLRLATAVNSPARVSRRNPRPCLLPEGGTPQGFGFQASGLLDRPVSGSFHPPSGVLFSFPSRYSSAIGLGTYLALEVGDPRLPLPFKVGYSGRGRCPPEL